MAILRERGVLRAGKVSASSSSPDVRYWLVAKHRSHHGCSRRASLTGSGWALSWMTWAAEGVEWREQSPAGPQEDHWVRWSKVVPPMIGDVEDVPLTVSRLRALLLPSDVDLVSLDGQRADQTCVLEHRGNGWLVFYLERGRKRGFRSMLQRMRPVGIFCPGYLHRIGNGLAGNAGTCRKPIATSRQANGWRRRSVLAEIRMAAMH